MKITTIALIGAAIAGGAAIAQARPQGGPFAGPGGLPFGLGPEDLVGAIFAKHDVNEDNQLDADEIAASVASGIERRKARFEERGFNRNRPDDFEPPAPVNIAARMIERHDANADGVLNTEEVLEIVKRPLGKRDRRGNRSGLGKGPRRGPPQAPDATEE